MSKFLDAIRERHQDAEILDVRLSVHDTLKEPVRPFGEAKTAFSVMSEAMDEALAEAVRTAEEIDIADLEEIERRRAALREGNAAALEARNRSGRKGLHSRIREIWARFTDSTAGTEADDE